MKTRARYGIDGPNAIVGLLLGALGLWIIAAVTYFYVFSATLKSAFIQGFWWASFCILSVLLMILSSLFGKFVMRDKLIDDLKINGDESILDVGCGRGLLLIAVAKKLKTGKAFGIDLWSQQDLSRNSEQNTLKNAEIEKVSDRVELITGDMTTMNFDDNSFDIIVSSMAIHNLKTRTLREKSIHEINRVLKPGGRIALLDFMCTEEYLNEFKKLGWKDIKLSKRYCWQFPPAKIVSGRKPLERQ